ncbi:tRNASer (uridine44-2'-O)-methyltransferase [Mytilus galloprovincialis]|uniref:tRNA (uracil-O(2)-)-methyltransferase n=1 Tax=Mytilus galloprovincialis TaxID=29158 RepID=A0A8B6GY07_MYTGA|nr:tRNASer (uridine44-2'-O)-methyltransferase [Mytilus galloprovincialis]
MFYTKDFTLVSEKDTHGSKYGFISSLTVWINKPHVVNRRLCGAKIDYFAFIEEQQLSIKLSELTNDIDLGVNGHGEHDLLEIDNLQGITENEVAVILRKLILKSAKDINHGPQSEIIVVENKESCVIASFYQISREDSKLNILEPSSYQLVFIQGSDESNKIQLKKLKDSEQASNDDFGTFEWMTNTLLPKLCNWSAESKLKTSVTSLRLIPIEEYSQKYQDLKEKYGKHFVQNWPESTDPQKFVYEDIAIASYLLILWKKEREKKKLECLQSFVDLGCGNGLLVHLLASEGHSGIGLDIRKRKIWNMYGKETVLKEVTVTPSAENTFPEYDWLIGNHSDELTPWMPVFAARSSYTCRYFVLPCCHFDFDCKFSGKQQGLSNYRTYLNFVKEVGEVCGFNVEEDTLRIPSTKRVCFIGQDRTYPKEEESSIDDKRSIYIRTRSSSNQSSNSEADDQHSAKYQKLDNGQKWSKEFEPRDQSKEKSRNCQNIDKDIKNLIINTVFKKVLDCDKTEVRHLSDGRIWHKGGSLPLGEVVKLFEKDVLKQLKSECGGLQTLLKNHNSIFHVSGGNVQLRDLSLDEPYSKKSQLSKKDKSQYFKTLQCWFYANHPDGCPRTEVTCTFAHGEKDIKQIICDKTNDLKADDYSVDEG